MVNYHPLLKNAVELHCHSAPSAFARKQNDRQLVRDVKAAGMSGVLIKSHESLTSDRASLLREYQPDLHIYGGLVCNYFTGGLSPYAVDMAIRLGAKCIWMPTISSKQHMDHFDHKKTNLFASDHPVLQPDYGLTILDDKKTILPEVHEILALIAQADIMLGTGHLSVKEVIALVDAAFKHGVRKILVQHAEVGIAPIPMDVQLQLAAKGAIIEKCYLACSNDFKSITVEKMANTMEKIGYDSCVMVTDYGQAHNIPVVQAFSNFVTETLASGVSESAITQMISTNPRKLLNI